MCFSVRYIWTEARALREKEVDQSATLRLIEKVGTHLEDFGNNKTKKATIWKEIGETLLNEGFQLRSPGGPTQCAQKYRNLERTYKDNFQYSQTTGKGASSPPEFYEELHTLLSSKHTVHPVSLLDTLNTDADGSVITLDDEPSTSKSGPPKKHRKTENMVTLMKEFKEEDRERQGQVMETMGKVLESITEQNQILKKNNGKREEVEKKQLEAIERMHNERLDVQKSMIEVLKNLK